VLTPGRARAESPCMGAQRAVADACWRFKINPSLRRGREADLSARVRDPSLALSLVRRSRVSLVARKGQADLIRAEVPVAAG